MGLLIASALAIEACATLGGGPRTERSSYACMSMVRDRVPPAIPDKRAHCLAAGAIALHCSVPEAYIAGVGKEISDLFTGGDAQWSDIRADVAGIRCAQAGPSDAGLALCCSKIPPLPGSRPIRPGNGDGKVPH